MNKKILLIGEICKDIYKYGTVVRLNPEAPTPILLNPKTSINDGMSGNVRQNILSLSDNNIDITHLHNTDEIIKERLVDDKSGYILLRVDVEPTLKPHSFVDFTNYDAVIVSDYNKGFLTKETISQYGDRCKKLNIPCFLDTKKRIGHWSKDFIIKINNTEFDLHESITDEFYSKLIVTQGPKGATLYEKNRTEHYETQKVSVSDVSGAGDTFISALVVKFLETNGDLPQSIKYANKSAGIAVSKPGVSVVYKNEVL